MQYWKNIFILQNFTFFSAKIPRPNCEAGAAGVEAKWFLTSFVSVFQSVSSFVSPSAVEPTASSVRTISSVRVFFLSLQIMDGINTQMLVIVLPSLVNK